MKRSSEPHIYFIRHSIHKKSENYEKVIAMLKKKKRIAILFTNKAFPKWDEYPPKAKTQKFKKAWDCIEKIKKDGGVVLAQYFRGEYLIGTIKKGSRLKFISPAYAPEFKGLKTLRLHKTRLVTNEQYPLLPAIKPMYSSISPIKSKSGCVYVMHAYGKTGWKPSLDCLLPKLQETMCAEWLRSKYCPKRYRLHHLLASIGKTMEAVDILGRTINGEKLYAQVTHHGKPKKVQKKREALLGFTNQHGINLMFSNDSSSSHDIIKNISLTKVWNDLIQDKKYQKMLYEMSGVSNKVRR